MEFETYLKDGERLDDLQCGGLKVIQDPNGFCFGTDTVLLTRFARVNDGETVVDLGTGCGVIPILLCGRTNLKKVIGIEIQSEMAQRAKRSVEMNDLNEKIEIIEADLKNAHEYLSCGIADSVLCNPPYGAVGASLHNSDDCNIIARHEVKCTLADCVKAAGKLVRNGGRITFVHQIDRLLEICDLFRQAHAQPKRIRLIHSFPDSAPNLFLIEAVKLAKPGLKWMPPLFVRDTDGQFSKEIVKIYGQ